MKSPFKFLDAYTKEDRDIFFGREKEIEELYHRVFDSRIMLVYGESGTGKSSLIQCGLTNKFRDSDWLPVMIRRGDNLPDSIARAVKAAATTPIDYELLTTAMFKKAIRSLYIDYYKPIFFIFDQFEELFIFGSKEEKQSLVHLVHALVDSDIECRFIFIMREEYIANVGEFEKSFPGFNSNRMRIERMPMENAVKAINGPCEVYDIEVEERFPEKLLKKLNPETPGVELTWLQVYLDKIFNTAVFESEKEKSAISFTNILLEKTGDVSDILGTFLDDQIALTSDKEAALTVLKSFVSVKGTKRQLTIDEAREIVHTLGKQMNDPELMELIQRFVHLRILRDKDQYGKYELRHDALAKKIFEKFTGIEKELIEIRQFIDNSWDNWQKRKVLISAEDIDYISPYESKLHLPGEISELIEKSKKELTRKRQFRRNLIGALALVLILVLSAFSVWALKERNRAQDLKIKALAENYNYLAKEVATTDPTKALRLSEYALSLDRQNIKIKNNIQSIYNKNNLYLIVARHNDIITSIAFSPDGSKFLTGSWDKTAKLWDLKGNLLKTCYCGNQVYSVAFSPDGKTIITGNSLPLLWDIEGNLIREFRQQLSFDRSVKFSPDGEKILGGSATGALRLWDLNGNTLQEFKGPSQSTTSVAFSPDGRKIAACSFDDNAYLWDIDGNLLAIFKGHINNVLSIVFSPDGQNVLTSSEDLSSILWDLNGNIIQKYEGLLTNCDKYADFSPDGLNFATAASTDSVAILWDLKGQKRMVFRYPKTRFMSVAFSPDGKKIITGSTTGTAIIWDLNGKVLEMLKGHIGYIYSVSFSPDGQKILTSSQDRTAKLWNNDGELLQIFKGHAGRIRAATFAPDGNEVLTGSDDLTARRWNLFGQTIKVLKGHSHIVSSVSYSPDGNTILTGSYDATAILWNLQGEVIQVFSDAKSRIDAAFFPDGKEIITGSYDHLARIYPIKVPYQEFIRTNSYAGLSTEDKLTYGIYNYNDVINSKDESVLS